MSSETKFKVHLPVRRMFFAGVGRISTVEDHGVVVFACDIEGEAKGIGAVSGAVVLGKGANKKRRHGKETRN